MKNSGRKNNEQERAKKEGERKDIDTTNSEKRITKENRAKNKMSII